MQDSVPIISAIVPVYNKGRYLDEALTSLTAQEYQNLEVIIINDGSTDDSAQIIESVQSRHPTLKIHSYSKSNGGASDARNFGVARAKGFFIVNMDADDIMQPGFLHEALHLASGEGADVVYSDLELFGDRTGEWIPQPYDPYYIRYDNCVPALAMYRREMWEKVGGYNVSLPFNEDWNFFVALSRLNANFRKIPRKCFRYRQTGTGLYHNFIREAWEWGVCMLMCAQDDGYSVDEVLSSCRKLMSMPERWQSKFQNQHTLHPNQWLPMFWMGVAAEGRGDAAGAMQLYQQSASVSQLRTWLPLYKLGQLVESIDPSVTIQAFHRVRILRPDMGRIVNPKIDELSRSTLAQQGR